MALPYVPKTELEYRLAIQNFLVASNSKLSNFNPGSRISTWISAIASVLAEGDLRTKNGFEYSIIEGMYSVLGYSRLPGLKSVGIVRIEHQGHTENVTLGVFTLDLFGLVFESVAPITIAVGETYVEIELRAKEPGTDFNIRRLSLNTSEGLGTVNIELPPNTRIWNPSDFAGGTNKETEESRLKRFRNFIISLGRSTPLGIYTAVVSLSGIAGVQLITNRNPYSNEIEFGWINLYVSDGTSNPPQTLLDLVKKTVEGDLSDPENFPGYSAAGTQVCVFKIPVIGITVRFELDLFSNSLLSFEDALSIATNAITTYLNTLAVGFDVLLKQVEATILKSHPDFYKVRILEYYGKFATDPVPGPLPPLTDISIPSTHLPRTGGTSGGMISGTISKVDPT
ncbi:baseplate J/gp47 family protein [Leptospira interrogans]|uniref:baseplate J/gp47 family protein n=1 Tax=Leptospira interrogans TaxID=173 RepID=UPI0020237AFF|nr:baseplate J/gp47 family protein [Leptospira interrogans]MCL8311316.1 baseplate J/gp47 family protein [Leptospira interrogans]MCR8638996.1 phage baseplate protein [Leptospira interrogans serovar Ricardi]